VEFHAVVVTDSVQGIVMLVGTIILLAGTVIAGGIENIMQELVKENPGLVSPFGADGSLTPFTCLHFGF
jgi:sodium/pantothenate symporter